MSERNTKKARLSSNYNVHTRKNKKSVTFSELSKIKQNGQPIQSVPTKNNRPYHQPIYQTPRRHTPMGNSTAATRATMASIIGSYPAIMTRAHKKATNLANELKNNTMATHNGGRRRSLRR